MYINFVPVVTAMHGMNDQNGNDAPLSPTTRSVLQFAYFYFGVHFGEWVARFAQDVLNKGSKILQDTFVAAQVSVHFLPTMCVLFVACRMRALQITEQQGSPQGWAQDCMLMCVLATFIQVSCCLCLPIFTNLATAVDADGQASYDLRPMVGAYAVTFVKYIALIGLHTGVMAICVSIIVITPETALREKQWHDVKHICAMVFIGLMVFLLSLLMSSAKVLGLAVKFGIETADQSLVGTQITVEKAAISLCDGYVNIGGLVVWNPDVGREWTSGYLLKIDKLLVKIGAWRIVRTLGNEFEITAVLLQGVDVNVEKSFLTSSNVGHILDHLSALGGVSEPGEAAAEQSTSVAAKDSTATEQNKPTLPADKATTAAGPRVLLHMVDITNVGAGVILQGSTTRVEVGNIQMDDVDKRIGGYMIASDIVGLLLKTILKTVVSNAVIKAKGVVGTISRIGNCLGTSCSMLCGDCTTSEKLSAPPARVPATTSWAAYSST